MALSPLLRSFGPPLTRLAADTRGRHSNLTLKSLVQANIHDRPLDGSAGRPVGQTRYLHVFATIMSGLKPELIR